MLQKRTMTLKLPTQMLLLALGTVALAQAGAGERTEAPDGASVYIIEPAAGARLTSPVTVSFGLRGMGVAPAGISLVATGHHHLLIDVEQLPAMDQPIPADSQHVHFGKGQTETTVELTPGRHTLQLLLGDYLHTPHQPPVLSQKIEIEVVP